jgi:hypothetical protein
MPDGPVPGKLVAPEPVPPVRQYSFTNWQVNNPTAPPPGDRLDAEFDRGNATQSQTLDWVGTSLNTDGTLRTGIVGEPQLVPGLFDFIANDAVEQVQPLVDQAGSYATQALGSANAALTYSSLASGSSTAAGQAATNAQASATTAQGAATSAQGSANAASASASSAITSANHADGSEAVAQAYADVGMAWAEHMPDTIPPNILAVQAVTGDHWSSRWWANRAAETLSEMESLLLTIPPLAVVYHYTYVAVAGQTVFTGADRDGQVLAYAPGPQQTLMVYANGLARTPVTDFAGTTNTVTFAQPRAAGDIVQIQVEGASVAANVYLPLVGGTMTGAITLAADPAGPLQPVTRQYADGKYLTFAGGTLTGPLVLAADPVAPLGAATRQYADTKLPLAGGVMTGFLTLSANPTAPLHAVPKQWLDANFLTTAQGDTRWVNVGGDTLTGPLVLAADPTVPLGAATRQYVDTKAGGYLPLAGGTVTGALFVNGNFEGGNVYSNGVVTLNLSRATFVSDASYTYLYQDGANWRWQYTRSNGAMQYIRGSDNTALFVIDGAGNIGAHGNVGGASLSTNGSATVTGALSAGSATVTGALSAGSATVTGALSAGSLSTTGDITTATLYCNYVRAGTASQIGDGTQQMYQSGNQRVYAFANSWSWTWDAPTGSLIWNAYSVGSFIEFDVDPTPPNYRGINWLGPWYGNGGYVNTSDERIKTHIEPATVGLAAVLEIKPIRFRRKDREREEIGFSAQQLASVLPEAVIAVGTAAKDGPGSRASDDPILGITTDTIIAALVNAVKELSARIDAIMTPPPGWRAEDGAMP